MRGYLMAVTSTIVRSARWAESDPDNLKTFFTLYARLIPNDITTGGDKLPAIVINVPALPDGGTDNLS